MVHTHLKPGTLIALDRGILARTRKVAVVVGPSRNADKVRVRLWQHGPKRWTSIRAEPIDNVLGPAPDDWPQTRAADRQRIE